jgi:hypothetical protein
MRIERLIAPSWGGVRKADEVIERPRWREVESRVKRLDGEEFNDIYLERLEEARWLSVGGGCGRYHVMLTINPHTDAESWWVAQGEEAPADRHELLTVGGQTGEFAARHIVPLSKALDAARAFFDSGEAGRRDHCDCNP